jgi:hypothetical protein
MMDSGGSQGGTVERGRMATSTPLDLPEPEDHSTIIQPRLNLCHACEKMEQWRTGGKRASYENNGGK